METIEYGFENVPSAFLSLFSGTSGGGKLVVKI